MSYLGAGDTSFSENIYQSEHIPPICKSLEGRVCHKKRCHTSGLVEFSTDSSPLDSKLSSEHYINGPYFYIKIFVFRYDSSKTDARYKTYSDWETLLNRDFLKPIRQLHYTAGNSMSLKCTSHFLGCAYI